MKRLTTVILAAGKGTRMKSAVPKVLHKVCGRPIIDYVLDVAKAVGSLKTYVVLGHQIDQIRSHLKADGSVDIAIQKKLTGTAEAVKSVSSKLKNDQGDVLIMCGDTPLLDKNVIKALVKKHKKTNAVCTFLTAVVHNPDGYGRIIRDQQGRAVVIREDKDAQGLEREIAEINVGVYCVNIQELLKALKKIKLNAKKKEYYLTDIIELFSSQELKIETVLTQDSNQGLGVNTKVDLSVAESIMRDRILKELMLKGVTIVDPKTTYIHSNVQIGADTIIYPCTVIEEDVKIQTGCRIGPFARIRPKSRIGKNVEIGNFTEVSRTKIGDHCFVKHFSFLGDAQLGKKVNIGAGTVTANYDGSSKNQTKISDEAFIGSDSVLVAPVLIGKKAIVGAGSVVLKGNKVADGTVVAGVPAQIVKKRKAA